MSEVLRATNLCKSFLSPLGEQFAIWKGVCLSAEPGQTISITGPSGSGKSTLLHILGTLAKPDSGELLFENFDVSQLSKRAQDDLRRDKIGFIFQRDYLIPKVTVWENFEVVASVQKLSPKFWRPRAESLLQRVDLLGRKNFSLGLLSGGERQRVAIICALLKNPRLVLADEPTGNLDFQHEADVEELLLSLCRENGAALIVATHNRSFASRAEKQFEFSAGALYGPKPRPL